MKTQYSQQVKLKESFSHWNFFSSITILPVDFCLIGLNSCRRIK